MDFSLWEILKHIPIQSIFLQFWPAWVFLLAIFAFKCLLDLLDLEIKNWGIRRRFKKGEAWRSNRDLLRWLRGMKPTEFEEYIADLFSRLGYKTEAVGGSHDQGIDVIAKKGGITHYIQCKKFITSKVPVGAVRDFYGSLADHLANGKGYFITTNKFTLEASQFAEDKPIELIDGFELVRLIRTAKKDKKPYQSSDETAESCPLCGNALVLRNGKYGEFLGCSNYPKCKYTVTKE